MANGHVHNKKRKKKMNTLGTLLLLTTIIAFGIAIYQNRKIKKIQLLTQMLAATEEKFEEDIQELKDQLTDKQEMIGHNEIYRYIRASHGCTGFYPADGYASNSQINLNDKSATILGYIHYLEGDYLLREKVYNLAYNGDWGHLETLMTQIKNEQI